MKHAPKLIAAIAILILALGVTACGSDDDSNTATSGSSSSSSSDSNGGSPQSDDSQSGESDGGADDKQGGSGNDEQNATGTDDDGGGATNAGGKGEDGKRTAQSEEKEAREFKPKTYEDSGGGSKQFRNPEGYDNSIQDYGSETTGSDFEEASANLHNFYDARAEGNWAATCLYMSADQIKSIETLTERGSGKDVSCAEAVEGLTGGVLDAPLKEEAAAIDVGSMRVEGDRAFLIYRGLEKGIYAIPMAKENGQWLVAGYAGSRIN